MSFTSFDITQVVGTVYPSSSERFTPMEAAFLLIGSALALAPTTSTYTFVLPDGPTVNVMVGIDHPGSTPAPDGSFVREQDLASARRDRVRKTTPTATA